jgi:RHS repeat-associated protein
MSKHSMRWRQVAVLLAAIGAAVLLTGCEAVEGYWPEGLRPSDLIREGNRVEGYHPFGDNTPSRLPGVTVSDPIALSDGGLFGETAVPDLDLGGPLNLKLLRYYDSAMCCSLVASGLGDKWMHNFDAHIKLPPPPPPGAPDLPSTIFVTLFHADTISFQKSGSSCCQLQFPTRRPYQLTATATAYQFMDPQENVIYTFDSSGNLASIADRNGNTITVTRTATSPGPTQVSDGLGHTLTFTYTGSNLTKVADQSGRSVSYEYTNGMLSAFTDANGKRTQYSYTTAGSATGLMSSTTRPEGNKPSAQTFDSQGRVATQSDSLGNKLSLSYNTGAGTATVTEPLGVTGTYTFGPDQTLLKLTDSSGASSQYTYDSANRPVTATDKLGNRTSATYDAASGMPASTTDELGNTTGHTYASTAQGGFTFYDRIGIRYPDGTSLLMVRDSKGNVTSVTDQAGQKWQATRNSRGQAATLTLPTGAVATFSYGQDGNLASVQLDSGDTYKVAYDKAGRPTTVTLPDGNTVQLQYDAVGNLAGLTDAGGNSTRFTHDGNNNLTGIADALGGIVARSYDTNDLLVSLTDALGKTTKFFRDALTRVQSVTNAAGNSITYAYDALNRPTSALDASGKGPSYGWDKENRLTSVTDALSHSTQFQRDAHGSLTQFTTPNGENYQMTRDKMARLISVANPLGQTMQIGYDGHGLPQSTALPQGISVSIKRDPLGNITQLTDPNGNAWSQAFDKMGRLTSSTDPLGQTRSYTYDGRQRISSVTFPLGGAQYNYDAAGNLTTRIYSDSTELDYTYDANRRLTGGTGIALTRDAAGRITQSNGLAIARDDAGRIATVTYATGKTVTYGYDQRGLLSTISDWVGGTTSFVYDDARELTSMTLPNGVREDYTYDANGRVATIQSSLNGTVLASIALRRDAAGRVTGADRSAPQIPDVAGSMTQQVDAAQQSSLATYDAMGREISDSARQYSWDLASRLSSYTADSGTVAFTYDTLGQRLARAAGGTTQSYVWNYATSLPTIATVQAGGADQRYYIWRPDGSLLGSVDAVSGARQFFHFDETGSTMFLSDDNGMVTDTYAMTPYGESVLQTGLTDNPFTWQGRYGVMQESGTNLFYIRARYYDGLTMRFLSRDSRMSASPREANPYAYAMGNPLRFHDVTGAAPTEIGAPAKAPAPDPSQPGAATATKGQPASTTPAGGGAPAGPPTAPPGPGFPGSPFDPFGWNPFGPPPEFPDDPFAADDPLKDVVPIVGDSAPPVDEIM